MNYKTLVWLAIAGITTALLAGSGTAIPASASFPSQSFKIIQTTLAEGVTVSATQLQGITKGGLTVEINGTIWDTSKTPYNNSLIDPNLYPCIEKPSLGIRGINDNGDLVGTTTSAGSVVGYFCDASTKTAIIIAPPNVAGSHGYAVNNSKSIVGILFGGSATVAQRGFIYKNKTYQILSYPDSPAFQVYSTTAEVINNNDTIVGIYNAHPNDDSTVTKLFQYSNGVYTTLPDRPGFVPFSAAGINDIGWVVANFLPDPKTTNTNTTQVSSAVLVNGKWQQIAYPGAGQTYVRGINNKGQLSGFFINSATGMASPTGFITNPVQVDAMVFDATNIASGANEGDGVLYDASKSPITEAAVAAHAAASQAKGLVADGNARLVIRVRSNAPGTITVTVNSGPTSEEPSNTGTSAKVYPLLASGTVTEGKASLTTTDLATDDENKYQSSFTLVAGYDYSGPEESEKSPFSVDICLKKPGSTECDASQRISLAEKRPPVLLLHGLWASDDSFSRTVSSSSGATPGDPTTFFDNLLNYLQNLNYKNTRTYSFDNGAGGVDGPSVTMTPTQRRLADTIELSCLSEIRSNFACTRPIFIAHSMGGLVIRKFVSDNNYYKSPFNFGIGSVSKLITLGTPNTGSQLANLLNRHLACINPENFDRLLKLLNFSGKGVGSGVSDLDTNSQLLKLINSSSQKIFTATFAGDLGTNALNIGIDLDDELLTLLTGCTRDQVFGGRNTDGIVPIDSSKGGLSSGTTITSVAHIGMGANPAINREIRKILGQKTSDAFSASIGPLR